MNHTRTIVTADEILGALDALDVKFLSGGAQTKNANAVTPTELIECLAQASEARMQSALIPLLLRHPEFAQDAYIAATHLEGEPLYTLALFYTAAMLLQKKYAARLERLFGAQITLRDLFSENLEIELGEDLMQALARVGNRHAELRGLNMNWTGGYEHAARTWLEYVELREERKRQHTWRTY